MFRLSLLALCLASTAHAQDAWLQSAKSGPWSAPATWEGNKVPAAGARVHIHPGHTVVYDVDSPAVIRAVNIAGTLTFARDKSTRLDVGLVRIAAGEPSEEGFDCEGHLMDVDDDKVRPALEIGTPNDPLPAKYTARIRLTYVPGTNKESLPALVCCGGRLDLHGAPMNYTWLRLGATAKKGQTTVTLSEKVTGWKAGDRVILTATTNTENGELQTEERTIKSIDGATVTLDEPLKHDHAGTGEFRGAMANLSRNVVIESAPPATPPSEGGDKGGWIRGHTMYHRGSAGAISYAEFRHLGKKETLGRYSIHYHLCGNTMRGSYVIGASIWDSHNRWITIHGTNYLVVRDCVGYQSIGHGYFLEDGTEILNVLDRNLAVQARRGKRLPKQVLPFDNNEGAGFWWANSLNTFTNNATCENQRYGYRYEATPTSRTKLTLPVLQPDGKRKLVDIRTLPFVRFEDNEAYADGLYGLNLGEGVDRVGPDEKHPFIVRNMKLWEIHYAFRVQAPAVLVDNMTIHRAVYGVYHPNYDRHVYRNLTISETNTEPFNRGHDDLSVQYGTLAVDGLSFINLNQRKSTNPIIQLSDNNPTGKAETHIRGLKIVHNGKTPAERPLIDTGVGPKPKPKTPTSVPIFIHDYFQPGVHAKVVRLGSEDLNSDGLKYDVKAPLTGRDVRVAEVKGVAFPNLLDPVDDLPPATIITHVSRGKDGKITVRGVTADNGTVTKVLVNGQPATSLRPNFAQWQATVGNAREATVHAHAEDAAGNVESTPHHVAVR